ncbi:MAG TPA: hypothetical protein VND45_10235 [Thermoanaerobaculia bacterium]|jgi:hypothetical protein|nr:hypothetical protein [Thermoanaerobaculia bacterium]
MRVCDPLERQLRADDRRDGVLFDERHKVAPVRLDRAGIEQAADVESHHAV